VCVGAVCVEGVGAREAFPIFRCSRTQFFQAQHAPKSSHELKASGKLQTRAAGKAESREASNVNAKPILCTRNVLFWKAPTKPNQTSWKTMALSGALSLGKFPLSLCESIWDFPLSRWFVFPVVRAIWQLHSAPKEMSFEVFKVDFHLQSLINMNASVVGYILHRTYSFPISVFSSFLAFLFVGFSFSG